MRAGHFGQFLTHIANLVKLNMTAESVASARLNHVHKGSWYTYIRKALGNVTTSNYWYNVGEGFKFSGLTIAKNDERCREYWQKYQWPISRLDTNTPHRLATQWLAAAQMVSRR